ncbi:MAG: hypothetical protein P4L65_07685 [Legionella sp.]|nr:hypothetical protein [Legionella sp.]
MSFLLLNICEYQFMPILVLDLDETVFVIKSHAENIDSIHAMSSDIAGATACYDSIVYKTSVNIINPEQISELINAACTKYDGVIILTAGFWDPSIRELLEEYLDLSEETAAKFKNCRFHSVLTDSKLFNIDPMKLRDMDKYTRLQMLINHYPELKELFLVLLDDHPMHVNSVLNASDNTMIGAVLATTDTAEQDFYQHTLAALEQGKKQETLLKNKENKPDDANRFFKHRKLDSAPLNVPNDVFSPPA